MSKLFERVLATIPVAALVLCAGTVMAADTPSLETLDSEQLQQIVREQDQAQSRKQQQSRTEQQLRERVNGPAAAGSGDQNRYRHQSRQQQVLTQSKAHNRQPGYGAGNRSFNAGGSGRNMSGGGRH